MSTHIEAPALIVQKARGINHIYEFVGSRPHMNRFGHETRILSWRGECCLCGRPFIATTPPKAIDYPDFVLIALAGVAGWQEEQ